MYISMQGNWTVTVKSKSAAFAQRFIIHGATSGNGTYVGAVATPAVVVQGSHWTINIQNNPGAGFQNSDAKVTFPVQVGGNYEFEIRSNDAGADQDFDDLILKCSTPVTVNDYLVFGNVKTYSGRCLYNPCYPGWMVIETSAALLEALRNPLLADIIRKVYPERIPPIIVNPNPPDPGPFVPLMLNLGQKNQQIERVANVFSKGSVQSNIIPDTKRVTKDSKDNAMDVSASTELAFKRSVSIISNEITSSNTFDRIALSKISDSLIRICSTDVAPLLTLNFYQYDRTNAELAGAAYTGDGNRAYLGSTITDMNGNYIFRFTQSFGQQLGEVAIDLAAGEDPTVSFRPDLIVTVPNTFPPPQTLYESAPYWNIPYLKRLNLCLPKSEVPADPTSFCFNGNLIGELGNVFIGGTQNTSGLSTAVALDRNGYNNHLHSNGRISVRNSQAGFQATCASWYGSIDVKGCMYNAQRKASDPVIAHYTIRYKKVGDPAWQFVQQSYLHPKFSNRFLPNYNGDSVGPFFMTLNVDGTATSNVPAYKNIQKEIFMDGIDWEFSDLDRYMQLSSPIYQGGNPGTVYFKVEGYDNAGNLVPGGSDMIALFIDNNGLGFSLDNVWFADDGVNIVKAECNLYRIKEAYLNTPLKVLFKANDQYGFLDDYALSISKCNGAGFTVTESPAGKSSGTNPQVNDAEPCLPYTGTGEVSRFGNFNSNEIDYAPSTGGNGKWLALAESYTVVSIGLTAQQRVTNGYNSGLSGVYNSSASVAIERLP